MENIEKKLSQIFKNFSELNPPLELKKMILERIDLKRNKQIARKLMIFRIGLAGSFAAFLYAFLTLGSAFLNSEFWNMLSLSFSDIGVVVTYWSDYMLSLLETFPAVTAALILAPIFTLFLSLGFYLDLINKNNHKYIKI